MFNTCKYLLGLSLTLIMGSLAIDLLISPESSAADDGSNPTTITTTYRGSNENFANPERGFATAYEPPWPEKVTWNVCEATEDNYNYTEMNGPLELAALQQDRANHISLALVRYHIAKHRHEPLAPEFIERLNLDFATARQAGVKLAIRFSYNWPLGGHDAQVDRVLQHLEQLKPVIQSNVDAIAFMEAGFIGCWGEWHHSSNKLLDEKQQYSINQNSRAIIDKIFEVLPPERMVAVRYPRHKFQYFGSQNWQPTAPLEASEAFSGSNKARWAHHDDCIVCGEWNYGTYWSPRENAPEVRKFIEQDNRYLVQSGEPGDPGQLQVKQDVDRDGYVLGEHDSCKRIVELFKQTRWSVLNVNYNPTAPVAYDRWRREGCYDDITKKLGYRFRLQESSLTKYYKPGGRFRMNFKIVNDGWAIPYNPRALEIVLRNRASGKIFTMYLPEDPRFWHPEEVHTVNVDQQLPPDLAPGEYEVLLNLPDPKARLRDNPNYSIRLANDRVWEAETGYNSFLTQIVIE
ncbi:MAG: DUF4832 domain-containing protein [Cyanobacteria bacterium J06623_7]